MGVRTVTIHDRCVRPGCNRILHSVVEAERGTCSSCWVREMPADTKKSLNRLVASAFNGTPADARDGLVDDAMKKLDRDRAGG